MRRDGRQLRYLNPSAVRVVVRSGRRAPRGVRVTECAVTVKAKDVYTVPAARRPGAETGHIRGVGCVKEAEDCYLRGLRMRERFDGDG